MSAKAPKSSISEYADLPRRMSHHLAIGPQSLSRDPSASFPRFHVEAGRGKLEVRLDVPADFNGAIEWLQQGQLISGAVGPVLRLANLRPGDTDLYSARLTEGGEQTISQSFMLVVTPSLSLTDQSARGFVTVDHPMICGFVVGRGNGVEANKTYLVRVITTSLQRFGIESPLARPRVSLARRNQDIGHMLTEDRAFHDAWAPRLGAFALEAASTEFVARVDLGPGSYTLTVAPTEADDSGEVLAEIYEINESVEIV